MFKRLFNWLFPDLFKDPAPKARPPINDDPLYLWEDYFDEPRNDNRNPWRKR